MSSLDEISKAIGVLEERTRGIPALTGEIAVIKSDLSMVKQDVSDFKPAARKIAKWEQRAIGVSLVSGFVGSWLLAHIRGWLG
jgi:hypothetical protein